jgi:hypothetical protein
MECRRCRGLLVEDHFFDFEGTHGFMWMKGWRCMLCGHAADPVIEANRRLHEAIVFVGRPRNRRRRTSTCPFGPKPSHGLLHDGGVGSTHTHTKEFRPGTDEQERL